LYNQQLTQISAGPQEALEALRTLDKQQLREKFISSMSALSMPLKVEYQIKYYYGRPM